MASQSHHTHTHTNCFYQLTLIKKSPKACQRDKCIACVSRRADAAVLPVASCEGDGRRPPGAPDVMELILSSQGSPIVNPPHLLLPQTDEPDEGRASATPASSTVRRASSSVVFNVYWEPSYGFIVDRLDFTAKNFDLYLQILDILA